jgi:glucan phosphoethanolaminetransferase (alkaline phosphatase superfamily)
MSTRHPILSFKSPRFSEIDLFVISYALALTIAYSWGRGILYPDTSQYSYFVAQRIESDPGPDIAVLLAVFFVCFSTYYVLSHKPMPNLVRRVVLSLTFIIAFIPGMFAYGYMIDLADASSIYSLEYTVYHIISLYYLIYGIWALGFAIGVLVVGSRTLRDMVVPLAESISSIVAVAYVSTLAFCILILNNAPWEVALSTVISGMLLLSPVVAKLVNTLFRGRIPSPKKPATLVIVLAWPLLLVAAIGQFM